MCSYCKFSFIIEKLYIVVAVVAVVVVVAFVVFIIISMVLCYVKNRKRKFDILIINNLNITHLGKQNPLQKNVDVDSKVKSTHG